MMHCAHCGIGECVRSGSDPAVLRCNYCDTDWTDRDGLAERLAALEAEHAKTRERVERPERTFLAHCGIMHADEQWCPPTRVRQEWRRTFEEGVDAIRHDLAEMDRARDTE